MASFISHPAFWGFWAALVYAGTALSNGLWLAEPPPDGRRRKHIIAKFVLAMIFGPLVAEALTPDLAAWLTSHLGRAPSAHAVAVGLGLSANYLWPALLALARFKLLRIKESLP